MSNEKERKIALDKNIQYNREFLKENIYAINLWDIIKSQKLDLDFIVKYILNKNYHFTEEEENINIYSVLEYQQHIQETELLNALNNYDSDNDSIEDFDSYSKNHS